MTHKTVVDLTIENSGLSGFFIFTAQSPRGKRWLKRYVQGVNGGVAYCDDRRCAWDIYEGAIGDGLVVDASNGEAT